MRQYNIFIVAFALILFSASVWSVSPRTTEFRDWIVAMKDHPKGPFIRVLWYCNDGVILPPVPYACSDHGKGQQHGKPSQRTLILRNNGYWVANLLAGIDTKITLARSDFIDWYNQLLIEKFLIRTDNSWIFQKAQFYRGAIQEENERDGARKLLTALVAKSEWITQRYSALRIGTQLLAHGDDTASVQKVRQMSVSLVEQDEGFTFLRTKIHVSPDSGDAELVRKYANNLIKYTKNLKNNNLAEYLELAKEIDRVYKSPPLPELLEKNAKLFSGGPWLQNLLRDASKAYGSYNSAENHYTATSRLLADLRDALPKIRSARVRLRIMDLSLATEAVYFRASNQLRGVKEIVSRQRRISWLQDAALAAYGTGHINRRSLNAIQQSLNRLNHNQVSLETYLEEINYLARVPGWSMQILRFQFYRSMMKLTEIEPKASLFIQDMLRGSPMLFFSQNLDTLSRDGNQIVGVTHKIFDQQIGIGFHALNPGLVRGRLYAKPDIKEFTSFDSEGIYLLPETIADLPPIAGIITVGEGNPLSHIQLLARNLGIPNVTVNASLLAQLQVHDGEMIVMAVSPSGVVEIHKDTEQWRNFFDAEDRQENIVIKLDLKKLDLKVGKIIDLAFLRAIDSGRIVGPKAAKLGELYYHYPDKVAKAIAIPFGVFRATVLDKPYKNTGQTVFEWMESQYAFIHDLSVNSNQRKQLMENFRTEIYDIVINTELGDQFQNELRNSMIKTFGNTNVGVFIRSDTNVEDLPGFTGAGLNLTLFNVIGINNIFKGISKVWASPFSIRAFSWRQSLMETPQHVYPAILIMQTVANEKSGVMITQGIDNGDINMLSIATNEGVGGAVDGQSSESLRVDKRDGSVRLLASASAPFRKVPSPKGGIVKLPVSGSETILKPAEIKQLIQFAKELPNRFSSMIDDKGNPVPADIEFGFYDGELQLFQLRPFLQSKKAQESTYLMMMDKALQDNVSGVVSMSEVVKMSEVLE